MNRFEGRRVSDHDAQIIVDVGEAIIKTGVAATAFIAAGPLAATCAILASEFTGVIVEAEKHRLADFAQRLGLRTSELPPDAQDRMRANLSTDQGSRIFY